MSVGVTLGSVYRLGNYRYLCGGGRSGTLYKAVLYLAIPLSTFVTLLSMYRHPWAYAQFYQLEQQSQSGAGCRQLRAKKFNANDNGRIILSQTVNQDNNSLTNALIYTSTANRTRISAPVRLMWLTHHPRNRPLCCTTALPIFSIIGA
ncbi:LptF/LptG family permease [Shigella flexneri]